MQSNGTIQSALCDWYLLNCRPLPFRETRDAYRIWVSEIMAQQTKIAALLPYYERFIHRFPMVQDLAQATEDEVLALWQGLGYYSRARNLHKAAKIICERYGGAIPKDAKELSKLPGIGAYTAGAIASIAFNLPEPAIDGNALRVFARLYAIQEDVLTPKVHKWVTAVVQSLMKGTTPSVFTQAVMELGALLCLPSAPQCIKCPLTVQCEARQKGIENTLPVRSKLKKKRTEKRFLLLLTTQDGRVLIRKRTERLLHNLYEFPGFESMASLRSQLDKWGVLLEEEPITVLTSKHIFTHLIWEMEGICVKALNVTEIRGCLFVDVSGLKNWAIPTAFKACVDWLMAARNND